MVASYNLVTRPLDWRGNTDNKLYEHNTNSETFDSIKGYIILYRITVLAVVVRWCFLLNISRIINYTGCLSIMKII